MRTIIFSIYTALLLIVSFPTVSQNEQRPERPFIGGPFERSKAVTITLSYSEITGDPIIFGQLKNHLPRAICVKERSMGGFLERPSSLYIRNSRGVVEFIESEIHISVQGESCYIIDPGTEFVLTFSLLDNFRFPKTKDTYTAFYFGPGFPFYDPPEDEPRSALESDTITFELDNRPFWEKWFD